MVHSIGDLVREANKYRNNEFPVLFIVGNLLKHATPDEVVLEHIGEIESQPVFKLQPQIWEIVGKNNLKVSDASSEWMRLNEETVVFPAETIRFALVANPANNDFATQPDSWKFFTYLPTIEE